MDNRRDAAGFGLNFAAFGPLAAYSVLAGSPWWFTLWTGLGAAASGTMTFIAWRAWRSEVHPAATCAAR